MHAAEEFEPAGDVVPLGHCAQDEAAPPAEYEPAPQKRHASPLRYLPARHLQAEEEFEPAGDVAPLMHFVQNVALPPPEKVLDVQITQVPILR